MDKKPLQLNKGMSQDTNEEFQPQGTFRFMLNGILESTDGEKAAVINELGTVLCFDISETYPGFSLIGYCLLPDNRIVLFITNNTVSIIGIQDQNCNFTELIVSECLGFNDCYPIDCIFKVHNGCDYYLYFTDNLNKYRSINIDYLQQYILDGYNIADLNTGLATDPNNPTLGVYGWDCSLMALSPDYVIPDIYLDSVSTGGLLKIGAYKFTFRYLDDKLNPTNWIYNTNPVYITKEKGTDRDMAYDHGGTLGEADQDGFFYANKRIKLEIVNIDTRYKYFQIGILEYAGNTAEISAGYISDEITIDSEAATSGRVFYEFQGVTSALNVSSIDPTELVVPDLFVNVVATHTQIENKLLIGNLTEKVTDWSEFQRAANDIQTEYFTYKGDATPEAEQSCEYNFVSIKDTTDARRTKNYSDPIPSYDNKSYMRDEVYALGIVWVFKDGSETPVMHIPGRPAIGDPTDPNAPEGTVTSITLNGTVYNSAVGFDYWANDIGDTFNIDNGVDEWDTRFYNVGITSSTDLLFIDDATSPSGGSPQYEPIDIPNWENIYTINECQVPDDLILRWRHVNTSIKCPSSDLGTKITEFNNDLYKHNFTVKELGIMGYYETDTEYPDVRGCDGIPIFPHTDNGDGTYTMHKIRHHLIPDARKVPIIDQNTVSGPEDTTLGGASLDIRVVEATIELLPVGIRFHNVQIPTGFEDQVQGYYIVRSDRAGNKTVIDKGWMNVCDTTYGLDNDSPAAIGRLPEDLRTIEQNPFFMTPTKKNGMEPSGAIGEFTKQPWELGYNIVEFFSPKSSFNDGVNLNADYYKLENTVFGRFNFYDELNDPGGEALVDGATRIRWITDVNNAASNGLGGESVSNDKYRLHMYASLMYYELPRIYNYTDRRDWFFMYKLPIQSSEYSLYNTVTKSIITQGFDVLNDNHRQKIMLSKLFYEPSEYTDGGNAPYFHKPRQTALYDAVTGQFTSDVEDIIPTSSISGTPTGSNAGASIDHANIWDIGDWIEEGHRSASVSTSPTIGEQFLYRFPYINKTRYSPFLYYVALKANITPYRKLESIKYIRTTNYIIPADETRYAVSGGDTFIARHQLFKSFYLKNTDSDQEYGGSLMYGYIESEINSQLRHKDSTDDYNVYPWDTLDDTVYAQVHDLQLGPSSGDGPGLREQIEHLYKYRLDYSKDNNDKQYFPLPDQFEYCDECVGRFPHTIYYSLTSFPDDTRDFYRTFKTNNSREIPTDSGDITNMILKEESLFVHTTNNLFRFNVAPQQLQTNNDTIQIGQGEFLNLRPVKLFDNKQGYSRGGCEFKFSGVLTDLSYIWVDNISGRVYSLSKGIQEISLAGMRRFFKNNLGLELDKEFKELTEKPYPYKATTCGKGIGFWAVYDPEHQRYILHKRDFSIVRDKTALELPLAPPYVTGQLYYDDNGFYVAENTTTITFVEQLDNAREYFEVRGFTISYSLLDNAWASFHSYLPSIMYHDSNTFFSSYSNNDNLISKTWRHNDTNFTTYADAKFPFIIDYISNTSPYTEQSYDTVEYTANVFSRSTDDKQWIEVPFNTFNRVFTYNNNQISNLKSIEVSNLDPYAHVGYDVNIAKAHKQRNYWRINRFRDMAINRLALSEPLFTSDWLNTQYSTKFSVGGLGWIDKVINPDIISLTKDVYTQQRFTDKFFGVRLEFEPAENYKMVMNLATSLTRPKL